MKNLIERKCEKRVAWNGNGIGIEGLSNMSDKDVMDKAMQSTDNGQEKILDNYCELVIDLKK